MGGLLRKIQDARDRRQRGSSLSNNDLVHSNILGDCHVNSRDDLTSQRQGHQTPDQCHSEHRDYRRNGPTEEYPGDMRSRYAPTRRGNGQLVYNDGNYYYESDSEGDEDFQSARGIASPNEDHQQDEPPSYEESVGHRVNNYPITNDAGLPGCHESRSSSALANCHSQRHGYTDPDPSSHALLRATLLRVLNDGQQDSYSSNRHGGSSSGRDCFGHGDSRLSSHTQRRSREQHDDLCPCSRCFSGYSHCRHR